MPDYHMMREIAQLARDHGPIEISDRELWRMFKQPERDTPLGNGIMNFCGLPTEKETMESWLRANELESMPNYTFWGNTWLYRRPDAQS